MQQRVDRRETLAVAAAGFLFLMSGAAALVYQVAWQRLLALHSGVGLYSVALIVAAFMAGLGIGSHLGGRLSTRLGAAGALAAFALIEIAIGAFGAASTFLYYDFFYPRAVHLPSPSWQAGLLHLAALLPPTLLMGMSLPFLVRAVVNRVDGAGRRIGWLYGINTLGAAAGAFAAPWFLLPRLGVRGAVVAAAGANLAAGLGALALWATRRSKTGVTAVGATADSGSPDGSEAPGSRPFGLWLSLYAASGFLALSLEIVWFRLADVAVKSTAFTFGTVLSIYLLGSAIGSLVAARLVQRIRRPLRTFLLLQCAIAGLAALPPIAVVALPPNGATLGWFVRYWADYNFFPLGHAWDPTSVLRLYVQLPVLLFFAPTVLMGASFPVLQRAVHDEPSASGRRVGFLQAANIAGCTAGSLLVGLVSLHCLGTPGTLRLLIVAGVGFAGVGLRYYGRSFVAPALVLVALAALVPSPDRLWRRLHGVRADGRPIILDEDATSVVVLSPERRRWRLSVNGKGNSRLPYGDVHTLLGAVPAIVHPAPLEVAVVGLGSGDTAWAASCRGETRSTTVFEISSPQPRVLRRLVEAVSLPETGRFLQDPRVHLRIEDGRKALEARDEQYDLIETDATWPETAGSGNLYSLEFFAAVARRLRSGGVMCSWAPTERIRATFISAFPYVIENRQVELVVGSLSPLPLDKTRWLARAGGLEDYFGKDRLGEVRAALANLQQAERNTHGILLNRDLFPRDEYAVK